MMFKEKKKPKKNSWLKNYQKNLNPNLNHEKSLQEIENHSIKLRLNLAKKFKLKKKSLNPQIKNIVKKRGTEEKELKNLKFLKEMATITGNLTLYDVRVMRRNRKILRAKNKKTKLLEEPKNIVNTNNVHKTLDGTDINFLTQTFNNLNDANKHLDLVKKQEKAKLLENPKIFRIKW